MHKFSIAPRGIETLLAPHPDNVNHKGAAWMIAIPALPPGEYSINKFSTANGDATIVIQKVGPPGDYC